MRRAIEYPKAGIQHWRRNSIMAKENTGDKEALTIHLPELVAKRLKLAATRANRPAAEVVVDILDRNLPRLEDPKKRAPYT